MRTTWWNSPKIDALSRALRRCRRGIAEVRQRGMMSAAVLQHDQGAPLESAIRCAWQPAHGVVVRPLGDSIILMPPLAMSCDEIATLGKAVGAAIIDVLG